jgi:hypothetical protein
MTRPTSLPFLRCFITWLAALAVSTALVAEEVGKKVELSSFELADQFGGTHRYDFPRQRPLILLVGDRKGSEEIDGWIGPLKKHFAATADITGIADMRGIPRFLRERITAAIKKSRPAPVMLDFDGLVTDRLPCVRKVANVFVIGPRGNLVDTVSGVADDARIATLQKAVHSATPPGTGAK